MANRSKILTYTQQIEYIENLLISNDETIQEKKLKKIEALKKEDRPNIKLYQQRIIEFNNLKES